MNTRLSRLTFILASLVSTAIQAAPVFTITPVANALTVSQGGTSVMEYDVRNSSGATLTITNETVQASRSGVTTDTVDTTLSNCANTSLANGSDCLIDIDVTGNAAGTDTVTPVVCAFNGQLCSKPATSTTVTVESAGTEDCSGDNPTCRIFVSQNIYRSNMIKNSGDVDTDSCTNNFTSLGRANCSCEKEAAVFDFASVSGANTTRHPGHWRALLSTSSRDAVNNIENNSTITYRSVSNNNQIIANTATPLTGGSLLNAVGSEADDSWTGSNGSLTSSGANCQNWTIFGDAGENVFGALGSNNSTNVFWAGGNESNCGENEISSRLRCVETPG